MKETEAFRALGSADRQILLYELVCADEVVTEEELARQVAARRHQIPPRSVDEEKIERAYIRLVHLHFPLLRELNIIEQDGGTVDLIEGTQRAQLLEAARELEEWPSDDPPQPTSP